MLISYFGKTKEGEFESVDINYPDIAAPLNQETHQHFNQIKENIQKNKNWALAMFNPIPENLQTQEINDRIVWKPALDKRARHHGNN